jgi:hypothetical protein
MNEKRLSVHAHARFALLAAVIFLTEPRIARAQGAAADALFNQAHAAMEKGDYETACQRFRESDRLDPAIGTKLNLAICEEKRGKLATAWDLLHAVVDKADASDERRAIAQDLADKLDPRVPKLILRLGPGAPKDTTTREGNATYGSASFGVPLPMDPGKHELLVAAPGRAERTLTVELHEGETRNVAVVPGPLLAAPMESAAHGATPDVSDREQTAASAHSGSKTLGFVLGGVGVAGVGVAAVTGILALGKKSSADEECNDQLRTCSQAGKDADSAGRSLMTISTIGWVVGVAGLAGAGAYFVLAGRGDEKPKTAIGTTIFPGGATATLSRDW